MRGYEHGESADGIKTFSTIKLRMEISKDIYNHFIRMEEICTDWVFEQIFSISNAVFTHMRTEFVVTRQEVWVPIDESGNGSGLSTETRILSVHATIRYGEYYCVILMGHIISVSQMRKFVF